MSAHIKAIQKSGASVYISFPDMDNAVRVFDQIVEALNNKLPRWSNSQTFLATESIASLQVFKEL